MTGVGAPATLNLQPLINAVNTPTRGTGEKQGKPAFTGFLNYFTLVLCILPWPLTWVPYPRPCLLVLFFQAILSGCIV